MAESFRQLEIPTTQFSNAILLASTSDVLIDAFNTKKIHSKQKSALPTSKSAVELFNDLSVQLTESYSLLENRVADLTSELNTVSEQRMQELKDKEQVANRLEHLINFLPGGVIVLDQRGIIVEVNPAAEEMLLSDLKGRLWRDLIQQCFSPKSDDGHEVSNNKGQRINIATRSLGEDGQIILLTDQTETRHLQAELSRHERLTALGKMVSTLAHQVRTPLSAAMLYGSHLLHESLTPEKRYEFTQKMVNRLYEMERQVRDMLLFVKAGMPLDDRITIGELQGQLSESLEMLLYQHSANCEWRVDNPDTIIICNKDALIGAILNLINNSLQAMDEGGHLKISFEEKNKNRLQITVVDDGIGIDEDIQPHINELFFTTKSQGTGIGLSVVNTVAKSHNKGYFTLGNNAAGGAIARLTLPIICDRC